MLAKERGGVGGGDVVMNRSQAHSTRELVHDYENTCKTVFGFGQVEDVVE